MVIGSRPDSSSTSCAATAGTGGGDGSIGGGSIVGLMTGIRGLRGRRRHLGARTRRGRRRVIGNGCGPATRLRLTVRDGSGSVMTANRRTAAVLGLAMSTTEE